VRYLPEWGPAGTGSGRVGEAYPAEALAAGEADGVAVAGADGDGLWAASAEADAEGSAEPEACAEGGGVGTFRVATGVTRVVAPRMSY
jgi:hypothetical protein